MLLKPRESGNYAVRTTWRAAARKKSLPVCDRHIGKTLTFHSLAICDPACISHHLNPNSNRQESLQDVEHGSQASGAQSRTQVDNGPGVGRGTTTNSTVLCVCNSPAETIRVPFTSFSDHQPSKQIIFWALVSFISNPPCTWLFSAIQINCSTII